MADFDNILNVYRGEKHVAISENGSHLTGVGFEITSVHAIRLLLDKDFAVVGAGEDQTL